MDDVESFSLEGYSRDKSIRLAFNINLFYFRNMYDFGDELYHADGQEESSI